MGSGYKPSKGKATFEETVKAQLSQIKEQLMDLPEIHKLIVQLVSKNSENLHAKADYAQELVNDFLLSDRYLADIVKQHTITVHQLSELTFLSYKDTKILVEALITRGYLKRFHTVIRVDKDRVRDKLKEFMQEDLDKKAGIKPLQQEEAQPSSAAERKAIMKEQEARQRYKELSDIQVIGESTNEQDKELRQLEKKYPHFRPNK